MDKRFTSAKLVAKSKLQKAMSVLDPHIHFIDQLMNMPDGPAHILTINLLAAGVATGKWPRPELDYFLQLAAKKLSIQLDVLEAFAEFQIATTELSVTMNGGRK